VTGLAEFLAANEVHQPRECGCVDREGEFSAEPIYCGCHYPARVLREVAAKRARLALMAQATKDMDAALANSSAGRVEQAMAIGRARAATLAVKYDAAIWGDHPDYDPAWSPS
jgi:hypothetical protein